MTSVSSIKQHYHEGQRGEEEADDQSDVRTVTHHHAESLTEGEELGFFLTFYNPAQRRETAEMRRLRTFAEGNA